MILRYKGEIVVDGLGYCIKIQALRRARFLEHEERETLLWGVGQPFVNGEPVAFRLRNFLSIFIEEEFIGEGFGRLAAQDSHDLRRQLDRRNKILARHFVIDTQCEPAHRPIGLPLQLASPTSDWYFGAPALVLIDDGSGFGIPRDNRDLQHATALPRNRQEWAVRRAPFRTECRQNNVSDFFVPAEHREECLVEKTAPVALCRAEELVAKPETVEECFEPRIVVSTEAGMRAEWVGNGSQRSAQILTQHVLVRYIVGDLPQTVHVVRKGDQSGRHIG